MKTRAQSDDPSPLEMVNHFPSCDLLHAERQTLGDRASLSETNPVLIVPAKHFEREGEGKKNKI